MGSASEGVLEAGDRLLAINGRPTQGITHVEAQNIFRWKREWQHALLNINCSPVEKKCPCWILFLDSSTIYIPRNSGTLAELEVARSDPEMIGELLLCDGILTDNDKKRFLLYIPNHLLSCRENSIIKAYIARIFVFIRSFRSTLKQIRTMINFTLLFNLFYKPITFAKTSFRRWCTSAAGEENLKKRSSMIDFLWFMLNILL